MVNNKGEEVGIIYGWYNTLTDMWYIGQTINPEERFKVHIDKAINKLDFYLCTLHKLIWLF